MEQRIVVVIIIKFIGSVFKKKALLKNSVDNIQLFLGNSLKAP